MTTTYSHAQGSPGRLSVHLRALRVHQWAKNILLFVPVVTAHRLTDVALDFRAVLGFVSFCLCTSGVYLINDLVDLDVDRAHPKKRHRPLASGAMSKTYATGAAIVLLAAAFAIALAFSVDFAIALGIYFALTSAYSFWLKRVAIVDVLCLAGLYALRVLAGGQSTGLPVSMWLLALSMFAFLSLALVKRVSELRLTSQSTERSLHGRGYQVSDQTMLSEAGIAAGYAAVLVFALYIQLSEEVQILYSHPSVLWFVCPLILYWITRMWLLTHRGEIHEDPVLFAIGDRASYIVGALAMLTMFLAR
jgi:4-hydroxybenzoate polyprenyltransferase